MLVETSIKETYIDLKRIYPTLEDVQLLYGLSMEGDARLFSTWGAIAKEEHSFASGGIGHYMADFLAKRLHRTYMSASQCVIVAAYILAQAKEHVSGCGGDGQIAIIRTDEQPSGIVPLSRIKEITEILTTADDTLGEILLMCGDLNISSNPGSFAESISVLLSSLETMRNYEVAEIEKKANDPFLNTIYGRGEKEDSLGFRPTNKHEKLIEWYRKERHAKEATNRLEAPAE